MEVLQDADGVPSVNATVSRLDQLIDEFKTQLDEALIQALALDYDLDIPEFYEEARATLSQLAESAQAEELTGFDPSGLGHLSDSDLGAFGGGDDVTPESHVSTEVPTSVSDWSDSFETPCFTYQTELSEDDKVANLRMIFGNFPDHTLKFELKGAGGNLEKAFEALLTRQFLEENGDLPKGVDGFYTTNENTRPGKYTKKREHKPGKEQLPVKYSNPPRLDADGIVHEPPTAGSKQPTRIPQPHVLEQRYSPRVQPLTLTERTNEASSSLPRAVKPAPGNWQTVSKKKPLKPRPADLPPPVPGATGPSYGDAAAAMLRKGPLYRPAAAYYAEKHRQEVRSLRGTSLADYEAIVEGQSDAHKTDLHGVPVLEGVRIAKDRVQAWWNGLSEGERERRGAVSGITVVTGVGHHSNVRGDSQLRRAVGAMLKNDGWRFETLTGQFHVTGRVRL